MGKKLSVLILTVFLFGLTTRACIWDADTLSHEKSRSRDLAKAILDEPPRPEDSQKLLERAKNLEATPDENNPDWWNNLAGTYLRLNQPATAAKLLEPIASRFPNDYGIHANLGTAYHLLGRYQDAEMEIAHDLEINPDAHFGLEKYHLALLQYLIRDAKYQSRHVYVDEFTTVLFLSVHGHYMHPMEELFTQIAGENSATNLFNLETNYEATAKAQLSESAIGQLLGEMAALDLKPDYRAKWNLAEDTNFLAGVIYMAQMNPKEPACAEMLGIAAWQKRNYHLAVAAFEKAIGLDSPQKDLLRFKIIGLKDYISHTPMLGQRPSTFITFFLIVILIPTLVVYYFYAKRRDQKRKAQLNL